MNILQNYKSHPDDKYFASLRDIYYSDLERSMTFHSRITRHALFKQPFKIHDRIKLRL